MTRRAQIHLADAGRATASGLWADAVGHCIAAQAAGAPRAEVTAAMRPALEEGRRQTFASDCAKRRAGFLAIEAMTLNDEDEAPRAALAELLAAHSDGLSGEAVRSDDDLATVCRRFDRLAAFFTMSGQSEETARKNAAAEVLSSLDALVEKNPSGWAARARRARALLDLDRYREAINDLRYLAKIDLPDPFVHTNLITYLRRMSHPEVVAAVGALMAVMPQTPEEFERWHLALSGINATPQAFALLEKLIPHKPEYAIVAHLRGMADDLDRPPAREFGREPVGRRRVYASLACWGATNLALLGQFSLPSLLAPGNLPSLCATHDLVLDIVTMAEDLETVLETPSLQGLAAHCRIRVHLFPMELARHRPHWNAFSSQMLGFAFACTTQRARRDGADLLFLAPDAIYADGFFAYVAAAATNEPRAVTADGLDADVDAMRAALEPYRARPDAGLTIEKQALVDLSIPRLAPRPTDHVFRSDDDRAAGLPQRVIFREPDGLVAHMFYKPPVYLSHAAVKLLPPLIYGPPDSALAEALLDILPSQDIRPGNGALECFMVKLVAGRRHTPALNGRSLLDSIRNLVLNYGFHLKSLDAFAVGVRYPTTAINPDGAIMPAQRQGFLAALAEERRTHPLYTELCVARDKHSRAIQLERTP